jgi:hypothetical protein
MTGKTFTTAEIRELIAASKSLTLRKAFTEGESEAFALCERMDEALEYLLQTMGWQQIETAPKDGRAILLLSKKTKKAHIGHWDAGGTSWTDEMGGFESEICTLSETGVWYSGGGWFQPNEVTNWREIPPPPEEKEGDQ